MDVVPCDAPQGAPPDDTQLHPLAILPHRPYLEVVSELPVESHWRSVLDHSRSYADFTYVYPVVSRRSRGLSIGINLNPDKVCNFDCVYCEVDRLTPPRTRTVNLLQVRAELVALIDIARSGELARDPKFSEAGPLTRTIRDIAFSGDGEPTMVHNFDECAQLAADVRRTLNLDDTKLVLITDAAGLDKESVRKGLEIMDRNNGEIWAKLDAGTPEFFARVNRSSIRFDRILANLTLTSQERPIIIQSLFLRIHGKSMPDAELEAYCDRLTEITSAGGKIREVHLYTVARPTPEPWATRLEVSTLTSIAERIHHRTGLSVATFA